MKNLKLNALIVASLLALGACSNEEINNNTASAVASTAITTPANQNATNTPANAPVIRVGAYLKLQPFDFTDEQGLPSGFEVDLIDAIAADQGMSVNIQNRPWEGLLDTLNTDEFDVVMATVGSTPERKEKFDMSDVILQNPNNLVVLNNSPIQGVADLRGKKIGINVGSVEKEVLTGLDAGVVIVEEKTPLIAIKNLFDGKLDGISGDKLIISNLLQDNKDKVRFIALPVPLHQEGDIAFAMKKGNTQLRDKINAGLANVKQNGTYDKIYTKWFGK